MNSLAWIGIIVWGLIITGIGLGAAGTPASEASELQPQDVFFLVTGGLFTVMIGVVGLMGFMGWIPGSKPHDQETPA